MRASSLPVVVPLLILVACPVIAADREQEAILVKPVTTWEGSIERDLPADGPRTVNVISDARGFEVPWRILRGKEKVPTIDFKKHFVVLVIAPGQQFFLDGLNVDRRGSSKVRGTAIQQPVAVPKGRAYILALFLRGKVKRVDGREVLAP